MSDTSLIFSLIGKDFMSSIIGGVGKNFDKFALGVGGAAAAVGLGLAKLGSDFDDAYDKIQQGTGATGGTLEGLKKDMKAVLAEVPASMDVVSTAITTLNQRTGATGPTLQKLGEQFVRLSQMTGTDVKTNIESATGAFNKWQIATGDQSKQLDFLFSVAQKTGVPIDKITEIMAGSGTTLKQFGVGFQDSATAIGNMQKAGINVESAMAGMKTGLANLSKAGKDPVAAFQDLSAKIKGAGTDAEANAIAIEVFGKKGGPELAAAIRSGAFGAAELKSALGDTAGTIVNTAKDTDDFKEKLEILRNKGMVALEPIALKVFDALTKVADGLKSATEWAGKHKDIIEPLAIALGVIAALFLATKIGMAAYSAEQTIAKGITTAYTGVQWALNSAMLASPITLIVLLIIGLVAAFVLLWEKSSAFRDFWIGLWESLKVAAEQGKQGFEATVGGIVAAWHWVVDAVIDVKNWIITAWDDAVNFISGIPGRVWGLLQGMWQFYIDKVVDVKNWTIDRFSELLGWIQGLPGAVWDRVQSMWNIIGERANEIKHWTIARLDELLSWVNGLPGAVWDRVQAMWNIIGERANEIKHWTIDRWNELLGWVSGFPGAIWDRVQTMWNIIGERANEVKNWSIDRMVDLLNWVNGLPGAIGERVRGMWDGVRDSFKGALNWIINAWNDLRFKSPGIEVFGQRIGEFTIDFPDIQGLAAGGVTTSAGSVLVGERGPELLHLPQGAAVEPLPRGGFGGGGGGGGVQKLQVTHVLEFRGGDSEFRSFMQKIVKRTGGGSVEAAFGG